MVRWLSRGGKSQAPEYTGVNDRAQQAIIDRQPRPGTKFLDPAEERRERAVRLAVERIAVNVRELCGIPEGHHDSWHAGRGWDNDAQDIWFQPNHWEYRDGRLNVGDRQWEVLGELSGQTGSRIGEQTFGSSIGEQRDTLFDLVAGEADRARINDPDAPEHRRPLEDRLFVDPGSAEYQRLNARVNKVWLQSNFGEVVNSLRAEGIVTEKTAQQLLERAPMDRKSMERWGRELASGELDERVYDRLTARPDKLELDTSDTALKGFLDDMAARSGTDPGTFLNQVQVAPPAQKAWQIAGSLMENSQLRDLAPEEYLAAKEKLSAVIDQEVDAVFDAHAHGPQVVRQQIGGQVIKALNDLEAEAVTPPQAAAQERIIDPRVGVAEPGGTPAPSTGGDGSTQRPDHPQSQKAGQQLGS